MIPPMRQKIWVTQKTDEQDRYGRPIPGIEIKYPARVKRKANVIRDAGGAIHNTEIEIDVPATAQVRPKQSVRFIMVDGEEGKGTIEAVEDSTNLSGNKVYFKVLMVNGT